MTEYYLEQEGAIVLHDTDEQRLRNSLSFMPQYQGLEVLESETPIDSVDNKFYFIDDPEYIAKKKAEEDEKISQLHMTRGDLFEALILAKGITKAQIRQMIETFPSLTEVERALYLNRFDEALDFYRGYPAVDLIGTAIGVTSDQLTKFFETKDYHYLTNVTVTINATPEDADVTIGNEAGNEATVAYGSTVNYVVSKEGYQTVEGTLENITENQVLDIELEPVKE